jgi:hypothetical protein
MCPSQKKKSAAPAVAASKIEKKHSFSVTIFTLGFRLFFILL